MKTNSSSEVRRLNAWLIFIKGVAKCVVAIVPESARSSDRVSPFLMHIKLAL